MSKQTCSIYNIHRGVLGTIVNPDDCRIHLDGRIRFEYGTCGREFFKVRNKKYPDSKISGYVWTGPKLARALSPSINTNERLQTGTFSPPWTTKGLTLKRDVIGQQVMRTRTIAPHLGVLENCWGRTKRVSTKL